MNKGQRWLFLRQRHSQMLKIVKFSHTDLVVSLLGYSKDGNWHCFVQEVFTITRSIKKGARNKKSFKAQVWDKSYLGRQ